MPSYLGQNFLKDSTYTIFIAQHVAKLFHDLDAQVVIEIGPGKGALTKKLIVALPNKPLILLEKDETLVPFLQPHLTSQTDLVMGDALLSDSALLLEKKGLNQHQTIVVGNLPYYITSPLLTHFFGGGNALFPAGVFMVQKEVADKICSDAPKKSFLWWLLNYQYEVRYLKTVPAKAFSPAPKVQSAVFSLTRKAQIPSFAYGDMLKLLERISMYKRKTLGKIWRMAGEKICDGHSGDTGEYQIFGHKLPAIYASMRLEELHLEDMTHILTKE